MSQSTKQATAFVKAIVDGNTRRAHAMLSDEMRAITNTADIADEYDVMVDDMGGVNSIGKAQEILSDWPGKAQNEIAIVYVPLQGDTYSEAITVTLAQIDGELAISNIEWGRP